MFVVQSIVIQNNCLGYGSINRNGQIRNCQS